MLKIIATLVLVTALYGGAFYGAVHYDRVQIVPGKVREACAAGCIIMPVPVFVGIMQKLKQQGI
jgi:hypothetical protein